MESFWLERKRTTDEKHKVSTFNSDTEDAQFQRDRARIIHSASFRRLQSKTQILSLGESDFYRTRLTHSLEVAQLGSSICEGLRARYAERPEIVCIIPSTSLIESICLGHDLGHPPFGHGGEVALNFFMKSEGGFEGNGQTLRIVSKLGEYSPSHGFDLTRRTLLGLLKYPVTHSQVSNYSDTPETVTTNIEYSKPPKCIHDDESEVLEWILKPLTEKDKSLFTEIKTNDGKHHKSTRKSFDTSIMNIADDIAYGVHDLEDALALGLVSLQQWKNDVLQLSDKFKTSPIVTEKNFYNDNLFSDSNKQRKHAISKLVGYFVKNIEIIHVTDADSNLLKFNATLYEEASEALSAIKDFVLKYVIKRTQVQALEFKGQQIITKLFSVYLENPERLLPPNDRHRYEETNKSKRVICDYIAGMTDLYATKQYRRLFIPDIGSIFDRL